MKKGYKQCFDLCYFVLWLFLVVYRLDDGTGSIECRKYIGEGFPYHPHFSLGDQVSVKGYINILHG